MAWVARSRTGLRTSVSWHKSTASGPSISWVLDGPRVPPSRTRSATWPVSCRTSLKLRAWSASLVGHSLGGAVVLHVAIRCPERVDRLVLVSSGGLGREISPLLRGCTLPIAGELIFWPSREGTARVFRHLVHDSTVVTDQMTDETYALRALPGARKALLSTLRDNVTLRGMRSDIVRFTRDNLRHIAAPTQVIWGRDDPIVPLAHSHVARREIRGARLSVFDACGHVPQLECVAQFNAVVSEFLGLKETTPS
jgi:pimeloyl-ACP methyl ester carboxylesterase